MEKDCEHEWESMGGVTRERTVWDDASTGISLAEPFTVADAVIFAVFCKKCGEIKEKKL